MHSPRRESKKHTAGEAEQVGVGVTCVTPTPVTDLGLCCALSRAHWQTHVYSNLQPVLLSVVACDSAGHCAAVSGLQLLCTQATPLLGPDVFCCGGNNTLWVGW